MPIKITNRWENQSFDFVAYKVQLSRANDPDEDVLEEGTIVLGGARGVPDEKLQGSAFKLTMIVGGNGTQGEQGELVVQGLSKDSEVTVIVTKPYPLSGTE